MYRTIPILQPVLFLPGLIYETLVGTRNGLYAAGLLPQRRLPCPVVSVGNITLGGAGKTPLVIYIAEALSRLGITPAVLSRGYGRRSPKDSLILRPGDVVPLPAIRLGDEPALMRRRMPHIWMGISMDRYAAGWEISQRIVRPTFILDDGFQHRKLHRDLDIVIIDTSQPLRSNRIFPRGTLREPLSELRRCHVVVINGPPASKLSSAIEAFVRSLNPAAKIFHCLQNIEATNAFLNWKEAGRHGAAESLKSAYLVAAVGNPERFLRDVQQLGIEVRGTRFFRDHTQLKRQDWLVCADAARHRRADAILTTEKDAIKLSRPPDFPLMVSIQSTKMIESEAFDRVLKDCIEARP